MREENGNLQSNWSNTYEYDEDGNIIYESSSSDWDGDGIANEVTTSNYVYDDEGNTIYESYMREKMETFRAIGQIHMNMTIKDVLFLNQLMRMGMACDQDILRFYRGYDEDGNLIYSSVSEYSEDTYTRIYEYDENGNPGMKEQIRQVMDLLIKKTKYVR